MGGEAVFAAICGLAALLALIGVGVAWFRGRRRRALMADRLELDAAPPMQAEDIRRREEDVPGAWASDVIDFLFMGWLARLYSRWMRRAGLRNPHAPSFFVLVKLVVMALAVTAIYMTPLEWSPASTRAEVPLYAALSAFGVWVSLDLLLWGRVKKRRMMIEADIPFWLDLHATLVEGGMGFDQALSRFVLETELFRRPMFVELRLAYQEINLGSSRIDALRTMSERIDVESLDTVVAAIVKGEQMGGGIADTLRAQADMMRNKVFEDARERAQKLPVKMLLPMIVGIMPSVFLVTVGPPMLRLLAIFEGFGA